MCKTWWALFVAAFVAGSMGLWLAADEREADRMHRDYCQRVMIHENSVAYGGPILGHRDYENRCTVEDLKREREALRYE